MEEGEKQAPNINLNPQLTPILYTDNVHLTINEDGVVLDIMQRVLTSNQIQVVARIGMSREHAKKFVKLFSQLVAMTEGQLQTHKIKN